MSDFRGVSPTSDVFSDEIDSLPAQESAPLKRTVPKHNSINFKSGYVPVNQQHLTKTGFKGRKTFAFWTLVVLLFVLAIGNLLLTITIVAVLRLGRGMQSIEFLPEDDAIKFFGKTDLGHLYKKDGILEGYQDHPINLQAESSALYVNLWNKNGRLTNKLRINKNGTIFRDMDVLEVKNKNNKIVFSTNDPHFKNLRETNNFKSKSVEVNNIVSPIDHKFKIESMKEIHLKGAEGTFIDGREVIWSADSDLFVSAINGSIILNGEKGTYIDMKRIPTAILRANGYSSSQYKICVCMPQGKLFKIPIPSGTGSRVYCHHINMSPPYNPCI